MQVCRVTGAERSHVKRLLFRALGEEGILNMETTDRERANYWSKVDKTPGFGPRGSCWAWLGVISPNGYPRFSLRGRGLQATHVALELDGKPRGDVKLGALHSCDNKRCVNPNHLRWGTDAENHDDVRERGRRGMHWLPDEIVHEIHQSSETNTEIALRIGVTPSAVCNIRKGKSHRRIFEIYCPITEPHEAA